MTLLETIREPAQLRDLTDEQLETLAAEMREKMIRTVKTTGGHLASSLGAVEITLALHRVMDSPRDRIVWDTGHQAYAHKLLTGRWDRFDTLRQVDGVGGFPRRGESDHDVFDGGHAGTGVSIGVGLAAARDLRPTTDPARRQRIAVCVGDAAIGSGLTMEALNHVGNVKHPLLIVLNDNEMSISPSVGGLSTRLNKMRLSRAYQETKSVTGRALPRVPVVGKPAYDLLAWAKEGFKRSWAKVGFFEDMGITYIGVLDGHDLDELESAFEAAFQIPAPVLVHVKTIKGRGYAPAEQDSMSFHGASLPPIDLGLIDPTEEPLPAESAPKRKPKTYTQTFVEELVRLAETDARICAITAGMPTGTGLSRFADHFPARFHDVGIAEQHSVALATGLALAGLRPGRGAVLDLQPARLRPARPRRLPERRPGAPGAGPIRPRRRGRHLAPGHVHAPRDARAAEPRHRLAEGRAGAARPRRDRTRPRRTDVACSIRETRGRTSRIGTARRSRSGRARSCDRGRTS